MVPVPRDLWIEFGLAKPRIETPEERQKRAEKYAEWLAKRKLTDPNWERMLDEAKANPLSMSIRKSDPRWAAHGVDVDAVYLHALAQTRHPLQSSFPISQATVPGCRDESIPRFVHETPDPCRVFCCVDMS